MRFAYLSCDFGVPVRGAHGSSVHVRETVRALRRLGHSVRVFSPTLEPDAPDGFAAEAVRLAAADGVGHAARELRALLYAERAQRTLLPRLAEFEPDVLYERYALFTYAGAELADDLGLPLILEVNAPLAREQQRHRELVLRSTAAGLEASILAAADRVVAVSKLVACHVESLGIPRRRISVVPNGVDVDRFSPSASGEEVRARYGLQGEPVVGFAGSLKPWHDVATLLDAVERVAGARLLVVGGGAARANGRALFAGGVAHEEMPGHLAAMDVVVVPYAAPDEYFSPLKLFEAMAMARPVVAARTGQVADVVADGRTGLLYEPGDAAGLARAIATLLDEPERAAELGRAARRDVVAHRTWLHGARTIERLARELLRLEVMG